MVGQTQNISRSGILIRAEDFLPIESPIECCLALALEQLSCECPEVSCRGHVVRTVSPSDDEPRCGSAVVIDDYDFRPAHVDQNIDTPANK
jgi:hypothetical protein